MAEKIKDLIIYLVLAYLVVVALYMAHTNKELAEENERLQEEHLELLLDYHEVSTHRDMLLDAGWINHNRQMKEGDQLE